MTGGEKNGRPLRVGLLTARVSRRGGGVFEAVLAEAQALEAQGGLVPIVFGAADPFTAEDRKRFGTIGTITSSGIGIITSASSTGLEGAAPVETPPSLASFGSEGP